MKRSLCCAAAAFAICLPLEAVEAPPEPATAYGVPALSRDDFNRLAAAADLPLYWQIDEAGGVLPRAEALLPAARASGLAPYVRDGRLNAVFEAAYLRLVEARRLEAVRRELDQGRPLVLLSDFRKSPEEERSLARHLAAAAKLVDRLYSRQMGARALRASIPAADTASRALFERNHGPWCEAPQTEADPFCSALSSFPKKLSDAYPTGWKQDAAMCADLGRRPEAKALLDPFTVVREKDGRLEALPLTAVYGDDMRRVAAELKLAAPHLGAGEAAFTAYLMAAARGFETNDWAAADEAWVSMNGRNSRWYLRVAPDENGFEPCQEKAGFHLAWARIDETARAWQDKLGPLRQEMEDSLAALIAEPYQARRAVFNLPDFISVVLNAGDSRPALGAIMGQSLPNWGKVAQEGRRRTVVMTNIYTDADSRRIDREKARQLLAPEALSFYPEDTEPGVLGTILHEAAHNLGPHSDTKVGGRLPTEIFGGRLEGVLEELKAQTAALWYVGLLRRRGLVTDERARQIYAHELVWAFGHISQGMFSDGDNPKPYSQLAAVQIGTFAKDGAMAFARTGETELFSVDFDKLPASVEGLMRKVARIKATGDAAGGKELVDAFVTGPDARLVHADEVARRLRKFPKPSMSYTVRY